MFSSVRHVSGSSHLCSNYSPGIVSRVNVEGFADGKEFAIYRKRGGIPESFEENVLKAMETNPTYNLLAYNCIHFAMALLGLTVIL